MLENTLKASLAAGRLGLAMIVKHARSPDIALAAKTCGYDAIYVDLEHSVIPEHDAAAICLTALNCGITPIVRVPSHEAHYANRILDAGALGIVAPHVETAEEARHIVAACRFAPLGQRSVAGTWPHFAYAALPADEIRNTLNAATTVVCMLESPAAVEHADEIAAVPGVDILHIGSSDLCEALGIPGQFGHPEVEACYRKVIAACRKHGKVAGVGGMGSAPDVAKKIIALGVRFITAGNEWAFMMQAAKQRAAMLRELPLN
jgi:2-keto-3-deoxy-L-rhamnonate aldolase RhmA